MPTFRETRAAKDPAKYIADLNAGYLATRGWSFRYVEPVGTPTPSGRERFVMETTYPEPEPEDPEDDGGCPYCGL
jgi:hypothetical protein